MWFNSIVIFFFKYAGVCFSVRQRHTVVVFTYCFLSCCGINLCKGAVQCTLIIARAFKSEFFVLGQAEALLSVVIHINADSVFNILNFIVYDWTAEISLRVINLNINRAVYRCNSILFAACQHFWNSGICLAEISVQGFEPCERCFGIVRNKQLTAVFDCREQIIRMESKLYKHSAQWICNFGRFCSCHARICKIDRQCFY